MRWLSTLCLLIGVTALGCSGGQKWVSDLPRPVGPTSLEGNTLVSRDASEREGPVDNAPLSSDHQRWGEVRPRISAVTTLGETTFPSSQFEQPAPQVYQTAPAIHVNNHITMTNANPWPVYGGYAPRWNSGGVRSFRSATCATRVTRSGNGATSPPYRAGADWPAPQNYGPSFPLKTMPARR